MLLLALLRPGRAIFCYGVPSCFSVSAPLMPGLGCDGKCRLALIFDCLRRIPPRLAVAALFVGSLL